MGVGLHSTKCSMRLEPLHYLVASFQVRMYDRSTSFSNSTFPAGTRYAVLYIPHKEDLFWERDLPRRSAIVGKMQDNFLRGCRETSYPIVIGCGRPSFNHTNLREAISSANCLFENFGVVQLFTVVLPARVARSC